MAVTAWRTCGTAATVDETSDLGTAWSNVSNATGAADSVNSTSVFSAPPIGTNNYLKCTNFGFSSSDIPYGSIILGIEFRITRTSTTPGAVDTSVKTYKAGSISGSSDLADTGTTWPTSLTQATYGGASQLWGRSWVPSDIFSSGFGVGVAARKIVGGVGTTTAGVDCVECRVTFTPPSATGVVVVTATAQATKVSGSNNGQGFLMMV